MTPVFDAVLVANRGEIAVRVIRTLHRLGVRAIAVFSDADVRAPHVTLADTAVRLGPPPAAQSYLHIERMLDAARRTGAQAIHPGYGFLSENPAFARACGEAGLVFIGPPPSAIEVMGDKIAAKRLVESAGVPVVPGFHEPGADDKALAEAGAQVGYPLLVKAAAGGGGKGMRVVRDPSQLGDGLAAARREARAAFGDDALLLERYLERPRHIEIQVLADGHGEVVHLGERECSLQRRHQKVVEEAPSPALDEDTRRRMGEAAMNAAKSCGYTGAGTVEFIVPADSAGDHYFLEMNTRLQVEHPVTEEVHGLDLVEWQVRIAAGERLAVGETAPRGHAVEARVYAEDPSRGFLPTGGRVLRLDLPDGVRVDHGLDEGLRVGSEYDPMLAKVVGWGPDRRAALDALDDGLRRFVLLGVPTNVSFLRRLLADPDVRAGRLDTGLIERRLAELAEVPLPEDVLVAAAVAYLLERTPERGADPFEQPGAWRVTEPAWMTLRLRPVAHDPVDVHVRGTADDAQVRIEGEAVQWARARWQHDRLVVEVDGVVRRYAYASDGELAWFGRDGDVWALREEEDLTAARHAPGVEAAGPLVAPMPGTVTVVNVAEGDRVAAGEPLVVVEAMKMEHPVTAPADGVVAEVAVRAGEAVAIDQVLVVVDVREGS